MSYICLSCHQLFDEPYEYEERHGLESGPFEHWSVSPCCHDGYEEASEWRECDRCGAWHPKCLSAQSNSPFSNEMLCPDCFAAEEAEIDEYLNQCHDIDVHIDAVSPQDIKNYLDNERS